MGGSMRPRAKVAVIPKATPRIWHGPDGTFTGPLNEVLAAAAVAAGRDEDQGEERTESYRQRTSRGANRPRLLPTAKGHTVKPVSKPLAPGKRVPKEPEHPPPRDGRGAVARAQVASLAGVPVASPDLAVIRVA